MTLREFLLSRAFFIQVLKAIAIMVFLLFIYSYWLDFSTNHGEEIAVPDLNRLTEEQVEQKLQDLDLNYVVLDTVDFRLDYPKYAVVDQDPAPGDKVKEGRKIYLKINSGGFGMVQIPPLVQKTRRQAEATLLSAGLQVGQITYEPHIGKDMVLEMRCKGRMVRPGDKVMKSSAIDLVLGDGKDTFEESMEEEVDSLAAIAE